MNCANRTQRIASALAVVLAVSLFVTVTPGRARPGTDDRPEARVTGTCTGGARTKLSLRADSGTIEVELEVDHARRGARWRVALVHERRIAWKGSARTTRQRRSFVIRRALPDLPGYDTVTARAWGPGDLACRATATLTDA